MLRKLFAALALLIASAAPAFASTDCTSTITWVGSEAGSGSSNVTVLLASGAWFYLPSSDPMFKTISAAAYLALTTQTSVLARFYASGLTCASATGRSDLVGFYVFAS